MLTIRKAQQEAFGAYMRQRFEHDTAKHLRRLLPAECDELGEPGLRDLIARGIHKGAEHGIAAERDVAKLVELMLRFGPEFQADDGREWASELLEHPDLTGHAKTELLYDRMTAQRTDT